MLAVKKEVYERAEMQIIRFYTEDAITTSNMIPDPKPEAPL